MSTNILRLTAISLRVQLATRCMGSALHIAAYGLLVYVDWRIALAVFLWEWAQSIRTRAAAL